MGCRVGTLFLGNAVYMYLSVAFIQMLKALGTVGVFCTGCIFGVEKFSLSTLANMVRQLPSLSRHRARRCVTLLRTQRPAMFVKGWGLIQAS